MFPQRGRQANHEFGALIHCAWQVHHVFANCTLLRPLAFVAGLSVFSAELQNRNVVIYSDNTGAEGATSKVYSLLLLLIHFSYSFVFTLVGSGQALRPERACALHLESACHHQDGCVYQEGANIGEHSRLAIKVWRPINIYTFRRGQFLFTSRECYGLLAKLRAQRRSASLASIFEDPQAWSSLTLA